MSVRREMPMEWCEQLFQWLSADDWRLDQKGPDRLDHAIKDHEALAYATYGLVHQSKSRRGHGVADLVALRLKRRRSNVFSREPRMLCTARPQNGG
jgi:hypothetical protein